jgi:hypothetical protein
MNISPIDRPTFLAAVERSLLYACRRAWREMVPDWRDREAAATVSAAVALLLRDRPQLAEAELVDALHEAGILRHDADGDLEVAVPELPEPLPSIPRSTQ